MCVVAPKFKEIINWYTYFLVKRDFRHSKLFFTFGRDTATCLGSLDLEKLAHSGRPLNLPGIHLPVYGL